MSKLPKISKIPLKEDISNNQTVYYDRKEKELKPLESLTTQDVKEQIKEIFDSIHHYYKVDVQIKTFHHMYDTRIIGKTENAILTMDEDTIPIDEIVSIKIKKSNK